MFDLSDAPPPRDDLSRLALAAATSVPEALSARRRHLRLLALGLVALSAAAPVIGGGAAVAAGTVVALAVGLRLVALVHCIVAPRPPAAPPARILPAITVLLPLKEEARVVDRLAAAVGALDYPASLIEVIVLIEEGDPETGTALRAAAPPEWRIVTVPKGLPRTKPRACNVGLALASGDVVVVFDAEDRPEPDQALKAVAALAADPRRAVVQARLGCDHARSDERVMGRLWALDYAAHFGALQPALARLRLPFLLGGTSNWFRADVLRAVGGWDAHNVTEDADLGVRLARAGWASAVIDSTTWEEAPLSLRQWVKQRSRWSMGFAMTTAVHFSNPLRLWADLGPLGLTAIVAQLPATLVCAAAHPFGLFLLLTGRLDGMLAVFGLAGYGIAIALHFVAARRQGMSGWLVGALPFYWLLQAPALALAAVDLACDPTRWRKTEHGLAERPAVRVRAESPADAGPAGRRRRPRRRLLRPDRRAIWQPRPRSGHDRVTSTRDE